MSLSIAIVGLPNVGKSTLFNALTDASVLAANYPFATIEPNSGIVPVPDSRLDVLAKMYQSQKIVPATVEFVDVAGLVAGASQGEGLGNKFLANIRETDAICHVVRAFESDKIQRADGSTTVSPEKDMEIIQTELFLADIASIESHLPKLAKLSKADPAGARAKTDFLTSVQNQLLEGRVPAEFAPLFNTTTDHFANNQTEIDKIRDNLDGLNLFSTKPVIYLFNVSENDLTDETKQAELSALAEKHGSNSCVFVCAELENEIRELDEADAAELLADYGVEKSGLEKLAQTAYETLGLQSFLTAGAKETRAWTIRRGATAPQAAGVIHSDFERGFIAAEVINYIDLIVAGSESVARAAGKIRTEGKTYVMRDGDVVEFRFNI